MAGAGYGVAMEMAAALHKKATVLTSLALASALCFASAVLCIAELAGFHIIHPLFWLPISAGTLGIAGSNYLYWKTYLKRS
jgi:hypothetical protein